MGGLIPTKAKLLARREQTRCWMGVDPDILEEQGGRGR